MATGCVSRARWLREHDVSCPTMECMVMTVFLWGRVRESRDHRLGAFERCLLTENPHRVKKRLLVRQWKLRQRLRRWTLCRSCYG